MSTDPFIGLMSLAEAAQKWNRADAALRQAIQRGKFKAGTDVKLFGKQWVITDAAMRREYGNPNEVEEGRH